MKRIFCEIKNIMIVGCFLILAVGEARAIEVYSSEMPNSVGEFYMYNNTTNVNISWSGTGFFESVFSTNPLPPLSLTAHTGFYFSNDTGSVMTVNLKNPQTNATLYTFTINTSDQSSHLCEPGVDHCLVWNLQQTSGWTDADGAQSPTGVMALNAYPAANSTNIQQFWNNDFVVTLIVELAGCVPCAKNCPNPKVQFASARPKVILMVGPNITLDNTQPAWNANMGLECYNQSANVWSDGYVCGE